MIGKWFRKKENLENLPEFWQEYSRLFEDQNEKTIEETTFVVFDTETTGLNTEDDRVLSIGALKIKNNSIHLNENFEEYLQQSHFNAESVKIHGLIQNEKVQKLDELDAAKLFLKYIGNSVLVGHFVGFDVKMMNQILKRHGLPKLKNKTLDTDLLYRKSRPTINLIDRNKVFTLDEIAEVYNIDLLDRHTATGDAYITAMIFLRLLNEFKKSGKLNLKKLLKYQVS